MGIGGYKGPTHTEEEKAWAKEIIAIKLNNEVKGRLIRDAKITEEYNKKFNRNITEGGLYTWLRIVQNPELKRKGGYTSKPKETKLVFGAKYILYINNSNICGFETQEEVQEFLKSSMILSTQTISLYEKKDLSIQYDIKIS